MAAWPRRPAGRRTADVSVAAGMSVFVVAVYVAVVLGGGALIGRTDSPHVGLSVLATAIVALGFEPLRARLQRVVAPTPYDVLARFTAGVEAGVRDDDVLSRMARLLAEGTGAVQTQVWLRRAGEETLAACWPPDGAPLPVSGPDLRTHDVRHHAEVLGRLTLQERPGHPLTPLESRLFADLARRSGLVLRNVRLTTELQDRVTEAAARAAELRASRRRVVCAHDDARRGVERDIHDGAQQHLVALAVTLRLARNLAMRDGAAAEKMLPDLRDAMEQTVATLTELSSGLYPRVLAEHGLPEALAQASRRSAVPVRVRADGVGRYSPELEAAVYFCSLEAVQNAAKHSTADHVDVVLEAGDGYLEFCVADNGRGFDSTGFDSTGFDSTGSDGNAGAATTTSTDLSLGSGLANMRDRVTAVGGTLAVHALPGAGTRVQGRVPLQRGSAAP